MLAACFLGLAAPAPELALLARRHFAGVPAIWVPLVSLGFLDDLATSAALLHAARGSAPRLSRPPHAQTTPER